MHEINSALQDRNNQPGSKGRILVDAKCSLRAHLLSDLLHSVMLLGVSRAFYQGTFTGRLEVTRVCPWRELWYSYLFFLFYFLVMRWISCLCQRLQQRYTLKTQSTQLNSNRLEFQNMSLKKPFYLMSQRANNTSTAYLNICMHT